MGFDNIGHREGELRFIYFRPGELPRRGDCFSSRLFAEQLPFARGKLGKKMHTLRHALQRVDELAYAQKQGSCRLRRTDGYLCVDDALKNRRQKFLKDWNASWFNCSCEKRTGFKRITGMAYSKRNSDEDLRPHTDVGNEIHEFEGLVKQLTV